MAALKLVDDPHTRVSLFRVGLEEERQRVVVVITSGQRRSDERGTQNTGPAQQRTSPERPTVMPLEPGEDRRLVVCHSGRSSLTTRSFGFAIDTAARAVATAHSRGVLNLPIIEFHMRGDAPATIARERAYVVTADGCQLSRPAGISAYLPTVNAQRPDAGTSGRPDGCP